MDRDWGCFGFALTVGAVLLVTVLVFGAILSSIGIVPVITADGLRWDSSAYTNHDNNRTQRYIVEQQQQTERNKQDNQTLQVFAVVGCLAGVLVVGVVQYNRTRRQQAETQLKLQMYLAYLGVDGHVGKYNGQLGVYDHDHGEFVPAGVAQLEMRDN